MNLLGHIYLSGNVKEYLAGNFIADDVKGKQYLNYENGIMQGIFLHRKIDAYTDNHENVKRTVKKLRFRFDKLAPVVADIFYDYLLAVNWHYFSDIEFNKFVQNRYQILGEFREFFPENMKKVFDSMVKNDWLTNYAKLDGIEEALAGIAKRTNININLEKGTENLVKNLNYYQEDFMSFFPAICNYIDELLKEKGFSLEHNILK